MAAQGFRDRIDFGQVPADRQRFDVGGGKDVRPRPALARHQGPHIAEGAFTAAGIVVDCGHGATVLALTGYAVDHLNLRGESSACSIVWRSMS